MRNRFRHRPHNRDEEEAYYQETLTGEDIPNQWSLKLKKIESLYLANEQVNHEQSIIPVDVKRGLLLTRDRKASITFDISTFKKYTICVINESDSMISFCFELSPNNINFLKKAVNLEVQPRETECVTASEYLKYARIVVSGDNFASVIVYLQGYK